MSPHPDITIRPFTKVISEPKIAGSREDVTAWVPKVFLKESAN
jgi:hypothetical protein